jgi:conjugal transfer mating pair stabilization protein TraN
MKILSSLFSIFVLILLFGESAIANLQQGAYQDGSSFIKQMHKNPGEPDKSYLPQGDVSHLQDTNETRLSAKGIAAKADPNNHADLLDTSQAEMIKAKGEHDINKNNSFYQKSAQIEANPFSQTGGTINQQKSTVTKEVAEYCLEGVDFQVDVVNQLTYVPPPWRTRIIYKEFGADFMDFKNRLGVKLADYFERRAKPPKGGRGHGINLNPIFTLDRVKGFCNSHHWPVKCDKIVNTEVTNSGNWYWHLYPPWAPHAMWHKDWSYVPSWVSIRVGIEELYRNENEFTEEWNIVNPETEKLTEENSCHEIRRACLDSGTKYFDGLTVSRPCWREQITYQCTSDPEDGCKYLKDRKCTLQSSHCSKQVGNMCMQYRRHYICLIKDEIMSTNITGTDMFCLDGNCFTPEIDQNTDMNEAVSKLAILQEMQKQMGGNPPKVFTGTQMNCAKQRLSSPCCI